MPKQQTKRQPLLFRPPGHVCSVQSALSALRLHSLPSPAYIKTCISTIKSWLAHNFLKRHIDKTELLHNGTKSTLSETGPLLLSIDSTCITPSTSNLGNILVPTFSVEPTQSSKPPTSTSVALSKSTTLQLNPSFMSSSPPTLTVAIPFSKAQAKNSVQPPSFPHLSATATPGPSDPPPLSPSPHHRPS